ncbi:acetyl-CoA carboxylase biotin carboxyl carrier protein subunit [Corynebacterium falsenii]|uniref:acetyl-CoA carboxylase biotin carboxyl carrier protein subunit n=1 Tax=Corynebacterium falsenii TaxID=108486 RepID=UPI0003E96147|nr:acetyl-CoA carboxylase biotin carboxyl carrier protein subunit [Corynebacterium falsenii]AHI03352.1 biotin carboxyl carrier protein [Corynebacterium falsenii DSM 44353]MDC7103318.1 acetyl-CoA carboxylase biotin carboxyl carrier protein subunit [Corynebacterium falsenii]UBI04039.1 acetyl-CoA carboxylase biotin carboxyl carrier protein subunit [Corynebacterium falsenii]UBI05946.1 acetyl-CoA carboxylase biotin carboxyl carrier protein subunit [Corynebacterium falsenii]HJF11530.1 acetyl-CoA car
MRICAPFAGIVHYAVAEGDQVDTGAELATVEAVKLEAPVLAPGPGIIRHVALSDFSNVSGGDVLLEIEALPAHEWKDDLQ